MLPESKKIPGRMMIKTKIAKTWPKKPLSLTICTLRGVFS